MKEYTPAQIDRIRNAIHKGRDAMRSRKCYESIVFAQAFVESGGVQIPGESGNETMRKLVAHHLVESLRTGRATSRDRTVLRELKRAHSEARWTAASESDKVVGFYLKLGPTAETIAACLELLTQDHGLGAGVFAKAQIVVLPPACEDYQFVPVLEDEVEQ